MRIEEKQTIMWQLSEIIGVIEKCDVPQDLNTAVQSAKQMICSYSEMPAFKESEDIRSTLEMAQSTIKDFWMHDATRREVCVWLQTFISKVNQT